MAISLHRQLLYSPKAKLYDFGLPEDVLDQLYELYVTTKEGPIGNHYTAVDVFNEVFYILTDIYDNLSAAEQVGEYLQSDLCIFPNRDPEIDEVSGYPRYADEYEQYQHNSSLYVFSFVWLILEINANKPKHVKFFLVALDKQIRNENPYFETFLQYKNKHKLQLEMDFSPCPTSFVYGSNDEWREETNDFDKNKILEIVRRFNNYSEQEFIVNIMRDSFEKAKDLPQRNGLPWETVGERIEDGFWDKLLNDCKNEDIKKEEEAQAIEKSKDERIAELEAQVRELKNDKKEAIRDKEEAERERDHWKREYEHLVRRINERNQQIQQKHVPSEFRQLPGSEIIKQLVNEGLIRVLRRQIASDAYEELYKWEGSKKLFGYFVERVSDELSLRKSGKSGNIIWEPFMQAFYNAEDLRHEAASAISAMKKKGALMPDGADKIEEAIKYADAMAMQYKD